MRSYSWLQLGLMLVMALCSWTAAAETAKDGVKVVYHLNDSSAARAALGNIRNHLAADPAARIVVVTHGPGVDFLLEGAKDKNGNPFDISVEELAGKGVGFAVCNNTLTSRKIDPKTVLTQAKIVPSGVAEVARLQAREGFVYLKP